MNQEQETQTHESPDDGNYLYRVSFTDRQITRYRIFPQGVVLPDEPDALLNIGRNPRIRIVDDNLLAIGDSCTDPLSRQCSDLIHLGFISSNFDHHRDIGFWTQSSSEAKAVSNAFRLGIIVGREEMHTALDKAVAAHLPPLR